MKLAGALEKGFNSASTNKESVSKYAHKQCKICIYLADILSSA